MLTAELCQTFEEIGLGEKWRQESRQEGETKILVQQLSSGLDRCLNGRKTV